MGEKRGTLQGPNPNVVLCFGSASLAAFSGKNSWVIFRLDSQCSVFRHQVPLFPGEWLKMNINMNTAGNWTKMLVLSLHPGSSKSVRCKTYSTLPTSGPAWKLQHVQHFSRFHNVSPFNLRWENDAVGLTPTCSHLNTLIFIFIRLIY